MRKLRDDGRKRVRIGPHVLESLAYDAGRLAHENGTSVSEIVESALLAYLPGLQAATEVRRRKAKPRERAAAC